MSKADAETAFSSSERVDLVRGPWLAMLLGLLCMLVSVGNGFTYDDVPIVRDNPRITDLSDWRAIWLSNWWEITGASADVNRQRDPLYRPLTLFSFALNHAAHGLRPAGFHLVNVLLHAGACGMVWLLARRLTGDVTIAAVAAVLFAVHPVHVEAVANIVGRAEVLAALFLAGGLIVLRPPGRAPGAGRFVAAAGLFLLGLLSKETAVCYPALAALALYGCAACRQRSWSWWGMVLAILIVPLLAYFPLRYVALDGQLYRAMPAMEVANPVVLAEGVVERAVAALTVLGHYGRLLIVPAELSADYGLAVIDPRRGITPLTLIGMSIAGGLVLGLLGLARRHRHWGRVGMLCAMFVVSYALVSNTVLLIGVAVAERLMYWPSVIAMMLCALGLVAFWRRYCRTGGPLAGSARMLRLLAALIVLALGLRSTTRSTDWANNFVLMRSDLASYPNSARLQWGYARQLARAALGVEDVEQRRMWFEEAKQHLDRALRIAPLYVDALVLRADVHHALEHADAAFLDVEAALRIDPHDTGASQLMRRLQGAGGDLEEELAALADAVDAAPDNIDRRMRYGRRLIEFGRPLAAAEQFASVLERMPEHLEALRLRAETLAMLGRASEAVELFRAVLQRTPDDWRVLANLATLLVYEDTAAALAYAERAAALQPDDLRVQLTLAGAHAEVGDVAEAERRYRAILERLDADDPYRNVIAERIRSLRR